MWRTFSKMYKNMAFFGISWNILPISNDPVLQVELSTSTGHRVLASALLDSRANSCLMDREFALTQKILLNKLPNPVAVGVIDGRPIAWGDIVEESEPIRVVLGNLASVISFNIISSPEHSLVLGLT